jgi:hypothetical protein
MTFTRYLFIACLGSLLLGSILIAQQSNSAQSSAAVPRLVSFSGKVTDVRGNAMSGVTSATFAVYKDQYDGAALWMETQNVEADKDGHYTLQLGATKREGLPVELFTTGEPRWLGVRINGGEEQPRVLLVSVPYALKAADADTLGGKPLSAFQLATLESNTSNTAGSHQAQPAALEQANEIVCSSGTACKAGFIPQFSTNGGSASVLNSVISQSGTTVGISGNESVGGSLKAGSIATGPISAGAITATGVTASGNESVGGSLKAGSIATGPVSAGAITATEVTAIGTNYFPIAGFSGGGKGSGVWGNAISFSLIGQNANGFQPVGVWGDSGGLAGFGVLGTEDNGFAVVGLNSSGHPTAYFENDTTGAGDLIFDAISKVFGGFCTIDVRGNLFCTGSKSAVVSVNGGSRRVALYAIEGSENWFEDVGTSQLLNGEAVVNLESVFSQTVNADMNYHVFLTPNGDCKGLYVTQKTGRSFVVRELGGGKSSIGFDYRIMAKRKGYENIRLEEKSDALILNPLPAVHPNGASQKTP